MKEPRVTADDEVRRIWGGRIGVVEEEKSKPRKPRNEDTDAEILDGDEEETDG